MSDPLADFLKPDPLAYIRRQLATAERIPLLECDAAERPTWNRGDPPTPEPDTRLDQFLDGLSLPDQPVLKAAVNTLAEFHILVQPRRWSLQARYPDGHKATWRLFRQGEQIMSEACVGYYDLARSVLGSPDSTHTAERAISDALIFLAIVAQDYRRHRVGKRRLPPF